jgi:hypothetical protein
MKQIEVLHAFNQTEFFETSQRDWREKNFKFNDGISNRLFEIPKVRRLK